MKLFRELLMALLRFVRWVYQRRPYEPESALRRTIDGQASARSPIYHVGMHEVYRTEQQVEVKGSRAPADGKG